MRLKTVMILTIVLWFFPRHVSAQDELINPGALEELERQEQRLPGGLKGVDGVGTQTMEEEEDEPMQPFKPSDTTTGGVGTQTMEEEEEMMQPFQPPSDTDGNTSYVDTQTMEEEDEPMQPFKPSSDSSGQMNEWGNENSQTIPALDDASKIPGQMEKGPLPGSLSEQEMIEQEISGKTRRAAEMQNRQTTSDDRPSLGKYKTTSNAGLIAHFPLDGSAKNTVGKSGKIYPQGSADIKVVPGKYGQAYRFGDGKAVIAAPIDIDYETYPQLTITAWVKMPEKRGTAGGFLVSPGRGSAAPALRLSHNRIRAHAVGSKPVLYEDIPPDTWTLVAGVWDYKNQTLHLQAGEKGKTFSKKRMDVTKLTRKKKNQAKSVPPENPDAEAQRYIFIGAVDFSGNNSAEDVAIDDVRIYADALSRDQLTGLIKAGPPKAAGNTSQKAVGSGLTPAERVGQMVSGRDMTDSEIVRREQERRRQRQILEGGESTAPAQRAGRMVQDNNLADSDIVRQEQERRQQREAVLEGIQGSSQTERSGSGSDPNQSGQGETLNGNGDSTDSEEGPQQSTAEGWHFDHDNYRLTSVSGKSGDIKKPIELDGGEGIRKIFTFEKSDDPCRVSIQGATKDADANLCGENGNVAVWSEINPAVVGGVMVCTNRINKKVKGIELRGHEINDDGSLGMYHQDTNKLNNCLGNWKERVLCGPGYLATGVIAHFNSQWGGGRDDLVGLQLICRKIIKN